MYMYINNENNIYIYIFNQTYTNMAHNQTTMSNIYPKTHVSNNKYITMQQHKSHKTKTHKNNKQTNQSQPTRTQYNQYKRHTHTQTNNIQHKTAQHKIRHINTNITRNKHKYNTQHNLEQLITHNTNT